MLRKTGRIPRFSILGLLILVGVIGVIVAAGSRKFQRALRQRSLILRIEKTGGRVAYRHEIFADEMSPLTSVMEQIVGTEFVGEVTEVELKRQGGKPLPVISQLNRFTKLEFLVLGEGVCDDDLAALNVRNGILSLDVSQSDISDTGLALLGKVKNIGYIRIARRHVTPTGRKHLSLHQSTEIYYKDANTPWQSVDLK